MGVQILWEVIHVSQLILSWGQCPGICVVKLTCFQEEMMLKEDPIKIEEELGKEKKKANQETVAVDRPGDCTQRAVDRPVDNTQQRGNPIQGLHDCPQPELACR